MYRQSLTLVLAAVFLLVACSLTSVGNSLPTETAIAPVNNTDVTPTQTSASTPVTQAPETAPTLAADWPSQLEIIESRNWSHLQLLKTFPAEIPMQKSPVAISPDGTIMAVGSSTSAQIHFFELPGGQLSRTVPMGITDVGDYFHLLSMEYLPDGTILANSTGPYRIYHVDADGNILSAWDGSSFALSADKEIMVYHMGGEIVLMGIADYEPLASLDDADAMAFSFSPDGSKIAAEDVGVDYLHVQVWDIPSKTILTMLDESANPRFSPEGKFLAVTKYDYENNKTPLKIFSPDGATEVITLDVSEPNGLSNQPALWSVDGSVIAAQIAAGSPAAWETTNWSPLEAPALQGNLYAFSPDGRILITRSSDGGILLWGVLP